VIRTVLKADMAMAAMEMLMAMNCFGQPGIEISHFCGNALIMSCKSSRLPSMVDRLTSVTDLVMALEGSSFWSSSLAYTPAINVLVLKTVIKLNRIHTWMYVQLAA
jgi:hypothetical protein